MSSRSLEIVIGGKSQNVFPLEKPLVRIGRAADNDIVLSDATRQISRWHAVLSNDSDAPVILFDLESVNGTFLNGRPITLPVPVLPDDSIKIGGFRLVLREQS
jgi:pSer/pThr/pTyr-binding forkhead associated (FHA) protein